MSLFAGEVDVLVDTRRGRRLWIAALTSACCLFGLAASARARPTAPAILCATYPNAGECAGKVVTCTYCHQSTDPPSWNAFGTSLKSALQGRSFESALPDALRAIEAMDADGDGLGNLQELLAGTAPGSAESGFSAPDETQSSPNPGYRVDGYDLTFAYRRLSTLYCGRSPSYQELQAFRAPPATEAVQRERLHAALSSCLGSDYWQKTALPRLADKRIRPLVAAGPDSQVRIGRGRLVIGDYYYDYRLWRYALSNDRDMRDLLKADYFVVEGPTGELTITREVIPNPDPVAFAGGQPLPIERRAGMITTQWFLAINTMFSALPRTSAAQAYRSYLGAEISANEGLMPIAGEPADVDHKGVAQPRCATCHSTLDPLAYAFAPYEGIDQVSLRFGGYAAERPKRMMPEWDDAKQLAHVLGKPVQSLVGWADIAANSDQFKRNMAELFFVHALGRKPSAHEQAEFNQLWAACPEDGYSANRLLHRLVDTHSFGAP